MVAALPVPYLDMSSDNILLVSGPCRDAGPAVLAGANLSFSADHTQPVGVVTVQAVAQIRAFTIRLFSYVL